MTVDMLMPADVDEDDGFPCAVYRLHDEGDRLLYVGISDAPEVRWKQHEKSSSWWPKVVRREVAWYDSRDEAETAEREAIETEFPVHNRKHAPTERGIATATRRALLAEAIELGTEYRRVERAMWNAILKARAAGVSDIALCDRTGQSRATLNRRYGSRGALLVRWDGTNLDDVQVLRPDARLADDGDLLLEHADGTGPVVVGINYVVHRREAE